ncbi:MAG: hypothetical protein ACXACW_14910, partial [Candidatus Hodarchaeales archaeon]
CYLLVSKHALPFTIVESFRKLFYYSTFTLLFVSVLLTHLFFILFLNDILFPFIQGGIDAQCDIQEER